MLPGNLCFFFRKTVDEQQAILDEIKRCTAAVKTNVIDQTAYIRAAADKKKLDLDSYRETVRKELSEASSSTDQTARDIHGESEFSFLVHKTFRFL